MQVEARVFGEPGGHVGVLVGGVVVQDQMHGQAGGDLPVDAPEELEELLVPMVGQALADDDTGEHVQRGEQGGRAVAFVVVVMVPARPFFIGSEGWVRSSACLLYTSDAADEEDSVDLGGRRIIKKNKKYK